MMSSIQSKPDSYLCSAFLYRILILLCFFSGSDAYGNSQQNDGYRELIACIAQPIESKQQHDNKDIYDKGKELNNDGVDSVPGGAATCSEFREKKYDPLHKGSYAMGISFYENVLSKSDYDIYLIDLINGLLRAESGSIKFDIDEIDELDKELKRVLDPVEASTKFLEDARKSGSYDMTTDSGVLYREIKVDENNKGFVKFKKPTQSSGGIHSCKHYSGKKKSGYTVSFQQVKPIDIDVNDFLGKLVGNVSCIDFVSEDVIRGWALVVDVMKSEIMYDVIIPSDLAYGPDGITGVEGGENLRFIMRKH